MTDGAIVLLAALVACWCCAAVMGVIARSTRGLSALRLTFGSARGTLLVPPFVGLAAAVSLYGVHRNLLGGGPGGRLATDVDGCVHWVSHTSEHAPSIRAVLFFGLLIGWGLAPFLVAGRTRRLARRLMGAVDRDATRRIRRDSPAGSRLFAVRGLADDGPLVLAIRGGAAVFLPSDLSITGRELAAVIAHERAHVERKHFRRRWVFESLLAGPMPRFLVKPLAHEARIEEECEADDDAARALGSGTIVARALVHVTESVLHTGGHVPARAARFAGGDGLRQRVERLLAPSRRAPRRFARALGLSTMIAVSIGSTLALAPQVGVWAFCQLESFLGMCCC